MDAAPSSPPAAGPPPLWRLAERRSRKTGSGNIFSNVDLCQLQRLFRVTGDQDAEQRANLVWGHRDETELAQALIQLRAKSQRRGLRSNSKDGLGSHWLKAFDHLRIGDTSTSDQGDDLKEDPEQDCQELDSSLGAAGRSSSSPLGVCESQAGASDRHAQSGLGLRRGRENDPERYLHRILH